MITRIALVCAGLALLSDNAVGQVNQTSGPPTREEFNQLVESVRTLTDAVKQSHEDTQSQLDALKAEVASVTSIQSEDRALIAQLSKRDKNGRPYVRLDASHTPTRNELRRAINVVTPDQGTVWIENAMNTDQLIAINDTTHEVMAKTRKPVEVPYGPFTVRLKGQSSETRFFPPKTTTASVKIQPGEYSPIVQRWVSPTPYYWSYITY